MKARSEFYPKKTIDRTSGMIRMTVRPECKPCTSKLTSISNRRKYGMDMETYWAMVEAQGGVCEICEKPETKYKHKTLSVDHDHATGEVRALLCSACNVGLGMFQDDPDLLTQAAQYLLCKRLKAVS